MKAHLYKICSIPASFYNVLDPIFRDKRCCGLVVRQVMVESSLHSQRSTTSERAVSRLDDRGHPTPRYWLRSLRPSLPRSQEVPSKFPFNTKYIQMVLFSIRHQSLASACMCHWWRSEEHEEGGMVAPDMHAPLVAIRGARGQRTHILAIARRCHSMF